MMVREWPLYMGAAIGLAAMALALALHPHAVEGWQMATRWTAAAGFPVFLATYSASSLGRLWPTELTRRLWRDRRWWGLGFAACHTVHLIALVTFFRVSGRHPSASSLIVGGGGYVMLYLMAMTSNGAAMRALGRNWRRLHALGIHWLWFAFAATYLLRIGNRASRVDGAIGAALALGALGLRIVATVKTRRLATYRTHALSGTPSSLSSAVRFSLAIQPSAAARALGLAR